MDIKHRTVAIFPEICDGLQRDNTFSIRVLAGGDPRKHNWNGYICGGGNYVKCFSPVLIEDYSKLSKE